VPLDASFAEQKKILSRCGGLFYACKLVGVARRRPVMFAGATRCAGMAKTLGAERKTPRLSGFSDGAGGAHRRFSGPFTPGYAAGHPGQRRGRIVYAEDH